MTQLVTHVSTFTGSASISDCGRYRYSLERRIPNVEGLNLCWLMLNPSTADATQDDPTIRKVMGFTKRHGYGTALVVNLFAWRSTDPRAIAKMLRCGPGAVHIRRDFAEGPHNCAAIMQAAAISDAVVCAWGAQPWAQGQASRVLDWLSDHPREEPIRLLCLGTTKDGHPLHPLMPSYDGHPLVPFNAHRLAQAPETKGSK